MSPLLRPAPPAGGQLYLTCEHGGSPTHLAYGGPAQGGRNPRNTAVVTESLRDDDLAWEGAGGDDRGLGVCSALFDSLLGAGEEEARRGVAAGFTAQFGRGHAGGVHNHEEL